MCWKYIIVLLFAGSVVSSVWADDAENSGNTAFEVANTTSFVWVRKTSSLQLSSDKISSLMTSAISIFEDKGINTASIGKYDDGILVPLPSSQVRDILLAAPDEIRNNLVVESDGIVRLFDADCDGPETFKDKSQENDLYNIRRVTGTYTPDEYKKGGTAWIVDSGVADNYDAGKTFDELNVVERVRCVKVLGIVSCGPEFDARTDRLGHGTMIAGIIAAKNNGMGVVGVAPGAPVRSIRIFGRRAETNLSLVLGALAYIQQHATGDDVINLSLGWEAADNVLTTSQIEDALLKLATTNHARIAVAAGNGGGYVQTVSPARIGSFIGSGNPKGAIMTASSIDASDVFSTDSNFGNGTLDPATKNQVNGPPTFAEPGENIMSLWVRDSTNICSGTSFAAAHLSGILLYGLPVPDGKALKDPSALIPLQNTYDQKLLDPIGKIP